MDQKYDQALQLLREWLDENPGAPALQRTAATDAVTALEPYEYQSPAYIIEQHKIALIAENGLGANALAWLARLTDPIDRKQCATEGLAVAQANFSAGNYDTFVAAMDAYAL